jgi:hypothetical protein
MAVLLFYTKNGGQSPLFNLERPDGSERQIVDSVQGRSLERGRTLYYVRCAPERSEAAAIP